MDIKLKHMPDEDLAQLRLDVREELTRREKENRKEAYLAVQATATKYGFTVEELTAEFGEKKAGRKKKTFAVKYRHPEDADKTWTGLGRKPKWLVAALELGHDLDSMIVN